MVRPTSDLKSRRFEMRLSESLLGAIEEWRRNQPRVPSVAEAMRTLVEKGLEAQAASDAAA